MRSEDEPRQSARGVERMGRTDGWIKQSENGVGVREQESSGASGTSSAQTSQTEVRRRKKLQSCNEPAAAALERQQRLSESWPTAEQRTADNTSRSSKCANRQQTAGRRHRRRHRQGGTGVAATLQTPALTLPRQSSTFRRLSIAVGARQSHHFTAVSLMQSLLRALHD